ncbi:MAG: hypothetical protein EXR47_02095 [Dehalococcoidia bacterium]|nr:hypothetical protein [Dehalococcoidia bacterium]
MPGKTRRETLIEALTCGHEQEVNKAFAAWYKDLTDPIKGLFWSDSNGNAQRVHWMDAGKAHRDQPWEGWFSQKGLYLWGDPQGRPMYMGMTWKNTLGNRFFKQRYVPVNVTKSPRSRMQLMLARRYAREWRNSDNWRIPELANQIDKIQHEREKPRYRDAHRFVQRSHGDVDRIWFVLLPLDSGSSEASRGWIEARENLLFSAAKVYCSKNGWPMPWKGEERGKSQA